MNNQFSIRRYSQPGRFILGLALLLLLLSKASTLVAAPPDEAPPLWWNIAENSLRSQGERWMVPDRYRLLAVDLEALDVLLAQAPLRGQPGRSEMVVLPLPLPDGRMARFQLENNPTLESGLAARYPTITTYRALGLDDRTAVAYLDRTPAGFHAMILSAGETVFIDPYQRNDVIHYQSYYQRDYRDGWARVFQEELPIPNPQPAPAGRVGQQAQNGELLRTYRLALAATGEYTQFQDDGNPATGDAVTDALAAMVTTLNRVNGIYEQDLSLRMVLINDNDRLVYTNPLSDPYSNNNGSIMLGQNQINLDRVIGSGNYDIGHVFSTGGGGIAALGVICQENFKARGVTGLAQPVGDMFDVDYVAHEMGHQLGGTHTFNANGPGACSGGTRTASTAYEPGGGSTIMAYAGICGSQNLQSNSDDYFHSSSISQILTVVSNPAAGDRCAAKTDSGNTPPTVEAGAGYTIPAQTPFQLTGTALDADDDPLSFTWEQVDLGNPPADLSALPNVDQGTGPIFRSFKGTNLPWRLFPNLSTILAGQLFNEGEFLPTTNRLLTFRLTVRDGRGGVGFDTTSLSVAADAGPFMVTAPNTSQTWVVGSDQPVSWAVADTNSPPVSCAAVDISLVSDDGQTSSLLLDDTPNDGQATVVVPALLNGQRRLRVACRDNIFFDLGDAPLNITSQIWADDLETGAPDWSASGIGTLANPWQLRSDGGHSGDNYWYVADLATGPTESILTTPVLTAPVEGLRFSFWHHYDLQQQDETIGLDGGVIEIRVNNGLWSLVEADRFIENGYNRTIAAGSGSPLAGLTAFSGRNAGYSKSIIDLTGIVGPGDTFQLRFRQANDVAGGADGWYVDDAAVFAGSQFYLPLIFN